MKLVLPTFRISLILVTGILAELHTIEETSFFNKITHFSDNMAHISSKGAYENKSWKRGSIFFTLKYNRSIWYKSVTQRLRTLLVSRVKYTSFI